MKPLYGQYKIETKMYNNPKQIKMPTEPKKKIDWTKIWKIIRDILIALLTAEQAREIIQ